MATLTYANIETRVADSLRLPTSNSTEMTKLQALINEVYRDIAALQDWWWLYKRSVINTEDDLTTGTVSVTAGSTAGTFSSAPATSRANNVMIVTANTVDSGAVFRIATHTAAAAAFTFDAGYTGATNTAAAYKAYVDAYSLPTDLAELLTVKRYGYLWPCEQIGPEEMNRLKTYDTSEGKPQYWTVLDFATTGDPTTARRLVVHPYPDNTYRLELYYKQQLNTELSGSTRPLIPDDYVQLLVYGTLARAYPIMLADAQRGRFYENLFGAWLVKMQAQHVEETGDKPQIAPDDSYRRFYSYRRRPSTGRVDLGTWFDRLPVNW